MNSSQYILVNNPIVAPDDKRWRDSEGGNNLVKIPTKKLSDHIQSFVKDISKILDKVDASVSNFEVGEIEVYASITTNGELSLLGVGSGGIGVEGGLKFVFRKKDLAKKTISNKNKPKPRK